MAFSSLRCSVSILWLVIVLPAVSGSLPKEAPADTPWEDLKSMLSSPEILVPTETAVWASQCLDPFINTKEEPAFFVSNYQLLNQSSGLCMGHASCAYPGCLWPETGSPFPPDTNPFWLDSTQEDLYPDQLGLPAMVLHPRYASDVVQAVRFANLHDIGVTVKVAGHSYFGASTARNTLLIKMSTNYPDYGIEGSLTECINLNSNSSDTANDMACSLALARGKKAILRVGGGEMFDQAYRAVSFDWNRNESNANKYHLVGGGAGTVSAAGGWLASGGLSGTTGMRIFGMGVDQVLIMEMVLPNGAHVRFGPSEWEEEEGFLYPKTTAVKGYCNSNALELDETKWNWTQCDESINFDDLWFAARGGGGGSYGIVTSLHYQLHDYPGVLQLVELSRDGIVEPEGFEWTEEGFFAVTAMYIEFVLKFLYRPSDLNVTEMDSNYCNSAQTASLNPFSGGSFFCYNTSGTTMVSEWQKFVSSEVIVGRLRNAGFPDEVIASFGSVIFVAEEVPSYADLVVSDGSGGVPAGRLRDSPPSSVIPVFAVFPEYTDVKHTHFPIANLVSELEEVAQILAVDALVYPQAQAMYALGGVIPFAHDQATSLSPTRRQAGFLKAVVDDETRNVYYDRFFGSGDGTPATGDEFPGSSCHNHALVYEMGPLKSDWTKTCPSEWTQAEREEKCISQNEAAWGTKNLARLEAIKADVDPDSLFVCTSGVGFAAPLAVSPTATPEPEPTTATMPTPTLRPVSDPTASPPPPSTSTGSVTSSVSRLLAVVPGFMVVVMNHFG